MEKQVLVRWEVLRTGLWPVPLGMILLTVLLYEAAIWTDSMVSDEWVLRTWWIRSGSGDDARNLLTTLVSAIITMSSVVFSITIVALSLAANQFGSRLVRTYMADIRTKLALGLFIMTVIYCPLALRAVEKDMPVAAIPHVTVTVGLALGLACVLTLLLFLHEVARSIVADEVIRRVAGELEDNIARLPPLEARHRHANGGDALPEGFEAHSVILPSCEEGYVQAVDYDRLVSLASRHGVVLRLDFRPGDFMCQHGWLGAAYPGDAVTPEIAQGIQDLILIGTRRTPVQDLEFSLRHLVDIALRALSPGINDANTALVVVERMRAALSHLMSRDIPGPVHRDEAGAVRVVGKANSYAGVFDAALNQIRQASASQPAVIIHLLGAIGWMAEHVRLPEQRAALLHHARLIAAGLRGVDEPRDCHDIEEALAAAERKLEQALRIRGRAVPGISLQDRAS